jgi:hypothetical protein
LLKTNGRQAEKLAGSADRARNAGVGGNDHQCLARLRRQSFDAAQEGTLDDHCWWKPSLADHLRPAELRFAQVTGQFT